MMLYSEALGAFSSTAFSCGICGVHGKTTTTGLTGTILKELDLPSQVLAGSIISSFGNSCTMTSDSLKNVVSTSSTTKENRYFVAETCEYQRHFMAFEPKKIILTSVESDHQDYYPTYEDIRDAFVDYIWYNDPQFLEGRQPTTGPELWEDSDGKIDILVAAVGTGGTISGTAKFLKEKNANIKIVGVQPTPDDKIVMGVHNFTDVPESNVPKNLDRSLVDEVITIDPKNAFESARKVAKTEGLLIGTSSGAALWAATQVAKRSENKGKTIAVILVDTGLRYLSTDLFG